MKQTGFARPLVLVCIAALSSAFTNVTATAGVVAYTETFTSGSSNWYNGAGSAAVDWAPAGGPNGSAFATTALSFSALAEGDTPLLFRAHDEFSSSGSAFVGNWVASGVSGFEAFVRHDADVPLNFFVRFASPTNFPGANNIFFIPVAGDTWTNLAAALPNPNLIFEGPFTYAQVFGNIGHIQIGISVPASIAGTDTTVHFGLDNVSVIPEPSSIALLGMGVAMLLRRRSGGRSQGR